MKANSRKRPRWGHWRLVGGLTLVVASIGILLSACMRLPNDRLSWKADDSTSTPTVTPWVWITSTPTRASVVEETPVPYCRPAEASINLSPSTAELEVDQTLTVTMRLANGETSEARLGGILYRLHMEPNLLALESDEEVEHALTLNPGDWDCAEFVLRAVEPGQVTLSGWASYEMHALDYAWGSNSGCHARALEIAITP